MTTSSFRRLLLTGICATAFAATPALAQVTMYPGQDVTVNPSAIPPAIGPNGKPLPPIHLHRPGARRAAVHRKTQAAPAEAAPVETAPAEAAPAEVPPPKPARHKAAPVQTAPATPPATEPKAAPIPFSFGEPSSGSSTAPAQTAPAAQPHVQIKPPAKGLTKQASVLFDQGSFALSDNSTATLNDLAFSLKSSLAGGGSRVELIGFGGPPGDTSSNSRRLSLERALAVRQALIVDGVPADRIDVRALGGVTDNGATDRVDIFVKA